MVDKAALAGLLDRAGEVFSLAGKLGQAFQREHEQGRPVSSVDATGWDRHLPDFTHFCDALLGLRESMQNPPEGFAAVADELQSAARVAQQIRSAMQKQECRNWAEYRDFFPELNSAFIEGNRAIQSVVKAQRLDDPFAFLDEPRDQPTTLIEMLRRIARRLHAKPDLLRGSQWDHPDTLNVTEVNSRAKMLRLGPIFTIGNAADWVGAPNLPADHPVSTKRIECLTVRHPGGSEYCIRRTGGQLDDTSMLPTSETIARLEAWIERAESVNRAIELENEMVVVNTAGDMWKAYSENKRMCLQSSAISVHPGANTPELTCPDTSEDARRLTLERAKALVVAEGGDRAAAMEKLIARVQLKTGLSKASVINTPLAEFVNLLLGVSTPKDDGEPTDLIERLLAGQDDAELTGRELAWLCAYLRQPGNRQSLADMQAHARGQPLSESAKQLAKLRLIRDFNSDLAKREAERDANMASRLESLGVREFSADAGNADVKHRQDDSHPSPKPTETTNRGDSDERKPAVRGLLSVFTDGLTDERLKKAEVVLNSDSLTLDEKLTKIHALMPFPATASAAKLGSLFDKSSSAVKKTKWWADNRKGERQSEIGRRRVRHSERAKQYDTNRPDD